MDATGVNVLYVRGDSPIRTLEQFVKAAKERTMTIGVNSIGAPPHLSAVQLGQEFGLTFKTLTMKTVPQSVTGLLGGRWMSPLVSSLRSSRSAMRSTPWRFWRIIGGTTTITSPVRRRSARSSPESNAQTWINAGVAVKAGTPGEIVARLVEASEKALNNEEYKRLMNERTIFRWISGAEAVRAEFEAGVALYRPLLDSLGLLKK